MAHPLHVHAAHYRARKGGTGRLRTHILTDLGLIVMSMLVAILLARTHVLTQILTVSSGAELLGTFIAGMFFTSIFTTAPAAATLGEISLGQSVFVTALVGALGSVVGDLLIFRFIKDRVASDILEVLKYEGVLKRLKIVFKFRFFRYLTVLLGGIIIASPLPDELGIALLGFSNMKASWFFWLSLFFNFLGILGVGLTARALMGIPV